MQVISYIVNFEKDVDNNDVVFVNYKGDSGSWSLKLDVFIKEMNDQLKGDEKLITELQKKVKELEKKEV